MTLNGASPEIVQQHRDAFKTGGWEGFLRYRIDRLEKAGSSQKVAPVLFADINVMLGRKDEAFIWLEKMFDERDPATLQFSIDPEYDSLRGDPRYDKLIKRIGLQAGSS
jgi:hypothetical protein